MAVIFTDLTAFNLAFRGKVRDIYELSADTLLMIATDRISAFDVILPTPIPSKGVILSQISNFWFKKIEDELGIRTHFISDDTPKGTPSYLNGRIMRVRKTEPLPVECVVRFQLLGSAWREYKESGTVHGTKFPAGLDYGDELPDPAFTPATKERGGQHDINIDFDRMCSIVGESMARKMRDMSFQIASFAKDFLKKRGVVLLDTKFEFGIHNDQIILIDEVFTPDSSRFWVEGSREFYDKEYIRQYLLTIRWDKKPPAPPLPTKIVKEAKRRYSEILHRILKNH